ncbi:uncharacterized protein K444DRAFT_277111 [Hyaloscypha bicolor E]|uniref:Uncharacterized protein n=1 Tax=Hyaloscypha bicolor E TaxID=1095630 RepID=A0A2J6SJ78_9HELO|nr:uncharacterized protein K444DRAFT_277111 [Hyaloscypha bicolor E]PMD50817.1 hypothetical protein K444DRAFT_277111 [Hyaloscypha bicolor E]
MDVPDRRADCILPPLPPPTDIPARSADHVPPPLPSPDLAWEWGEPNEISGPSFNTRAFQPGSSLHWRFGSRRSRLDEQPELPHRRRFTSTIEYDNAGASTDPEIGTNLHPLNASYTSLVPKGIASDRSKSEEASSAGIGFQNSVHERFRTNAQAHDKSVLEKLSAGRDPDYAPPRSSFPPLSRPSFFRPETDNPYPRDPFSWWAEIGPLSFQNNDDLTEPLDNVAGQKRRASSPPPLSAIVDSPWLPPENEPKFEPSAFDPFNPSPAGSTSLKNRYQPSLERQPLEPSENRQTFQGILF